MQDVAESVGNLVAGAVTGNLSNLGNVAEVMADNLQNVAGNIHTNIHSAVNNALGLFRQKTLQVQVIAMLCINSIGLLRTQHLRLRSVRTFSLLFFFFFTFIILMYSFCKCELKKKKRAGQSGRAGRKYETASEAAQSIGARKSRSE